MEIPCSPRGCGKSQYPVFGCGREAGGLPAMAMVTIFHIPFTNFTLSHFHSMPQKADEAFLKSNQMMCNNFNIIRMRMTHSRTRKTLSWPLVSTDRRLSWGQQIMLSVRKPRKESGIRNTESSRTNSDMCHGRQEKSGMLAKNLYQTTLPWKPIPKPEPKRKPSAGTQDEVRVAGQ